MSNTYLFSTAQTAVYSRMREIDSKILPLANVKKWLNDAHTQVLKERHYRFMEEVVNFNINADALLDEDITTTDTSFDVDDASGLDTSGTIAIDDDVITYTGVSSNTLTGVTGIGSDHESGAKVRQIYAMSADLSITDFYKPIYVSINESEVDYYDGRGAIDDNKYKIDDDDFLYFPWDDAERRVVFKYKKSVTDLSADGDTFLIPDDYVTLVIEFALYKAKIDLGYSDADVQNHFAEYIRMKKQMKNDFAGQTENKNRRVKSIYQPNYLRT